MRSLNELAEKISRSYATETNARRAFEKLVDDTVTEGGHVVLQRADGRFVNIVVNPDPTDMLRFIHNGCGVFA